MHHSTMARERWIWIGIAVIAAISVVSGMPNAVVVVVAAAGWLRALTPRLGLALSSAVTVLGWMTLTFLGSCLAYLLPFDPTATVSAVIAVSLLATLAIPGLLRPTIESPLPRWGVLASLAGAVAWLGGVVLGLVLPSGSGLSWAVYTDASLDVLNLRGIAANGGFNFLDNTNPRPLEHTLSASMLPFGHVITNAAPEFADEVRAHAIAVAMLVAISCVLSGFVTLELMRSSRVPNWGQATLAGAASVTMLAMPITGAALYRGEINAHVTWCILFATFIAARHSRSRPIVAMFSLTVAMTLALISWTPFAAVPGAFLVYAAWTNRAAIRARLRRALVVLAAPLLFFVWCFLMFSADELIRQGTSGSSSLEATITVVTLYANPAWMPLFVSALVVCAIAALALRPFVTDAAAVAGVGALGLVLGALPIFAARGSITGVLEYYPARYVNMATAALVPVLLAVLAAMLAEPSRWRRVMSATAAAVLVMLLAVAPMSSELSKWSVLSVDLATGQVFGRHDQLGDKVLDYASSSEYLVAWHADPPFDYFANWILGVNYWDPNAEVPSDGQLILRNYGRAQATTKACTLAKASSRTVVLMTRDKGVAAQVAAQCPDLGIEVRELSR